MSGLKTYQLDFAGKPVIFEFGKLAGQADGAVTVRYGDTVVLATAVVSDKPREGVNFLPLTVDYEERMYASGKISGSRFIKREGRPSEEAVLTARLIDRSIRPLFPKNFFYDIQVIITVLSADLENDPDIISLIAASAALSISKIPWGGPIAACRVGLGSNGFFLNPLEQELPESDLDLVVSVSEKAVVMVEAGAKEVEEAKMLEAIKFGFERSAPLIALQKKIQAEIGEKKLEIKETEEQELANRLKNFVGSKMEAAILGSKSERNELLELLLEEAIGNLVTEDDLEGQAAIKGFFEELVKKEVRRIILEKGQRPDGRRFDEIRPISCEVGLLPRPHGSGLFNRGQTQVLTVATLGSMGSAQLIDTMEEETTKKFMHHYNFPPFSTGEARPLRSVGRREIGHGALAERALSYVIPSDKEFPYTIRLVSEVLSSNGSTSMASVCGSTLALMDAGVPIKEPVAGVATGLVISGEKNVILSDIQGIEDFSGDMDFKVAGTKKGITALQLDVKIPGISFEIIGETFARAKRDREFILGKIQETIASPRKELSKYAPRVLMVKINPEKIKDIIGPGGKTINKIINETGVDIDVEQDGRVMVYSSKKEACERAMEEIKALTEEVEVGKIYKGKVTRTVDFGAFVEILPKQEGLVHISQISDKRVAKVEDVLRVGDEVRVRVIEIDSLGRINLTMKGVMQDSK